MTRADLEKLSTNEILVLHNRLTGRSTKKFSSRAKGIEQTLKAQGETPAAKHKTRESWLLAAVSKLAPLLKKHGVGMPEKYAVSCGFPKSRNKAIGQCWPPNCTEDETSHMFVCPSIQQATRVLDILAHEMIHAAVGLECKHRGKFRVIAKAIGLEGKMTETFVGEDNPLMKTLRQISESLGTYPHSALTRQATATRPPAGGWVKFKSTREEDYILRVSPRALEDHGAPRDPWGDEMEPA